MSKQTSKLAAMAVLSAFSMQAADSAVTATSTKPAPKADVKKPASNATYRNGDWAITATMALKESYDSNVFLQDRGPIEHRHSWVSTAIPGLNISFTPCKEFNATVNYAPELTLYHNEKTENNASHKANVKFSGKFEKVSYELTSSFVGVNGNADGPTYAAPGAGPVCGGIPVRDRRNQFVNRDNFKVTIPMGDFFVRPNYYYAMHDFKTTIKNTAVNPGYANYVDRWDMNMGLDVGYKIQKNTSLVLGYRYGMQEQARVISSPWEYSNNYHRLLGGLEGKPFEWLTLSFLMGPDWRELGSGANPKSDPSYVRLYMEGQATFTFSKTDSLTLSIKQFEQPSSGGGALYQDSTSEASWKHKFSDKWSAAASIRCVNYKFEDPTAKFDWVLSPAMVVAYKVNKHLTIEGSYSYDYGLSCVPNNYGSQYTRNIGSLGAKYSF